jgi:hypothetical protein
MSNEIAALSEPDDRDAPAWDAAGDGCAAPSAERRLKMLDRLAEAGLEIALAIERRVKEAEPAQPLAELNAAAMAYARAARAVRLAVLLQEQLTQGAVNTPESLPVSSPESPQEAARRAEANGRKEQVERALRIVKRVAKDHCRKEAFAVGAYVGEARDRLDNDDIYGLVATRPLGELVAMICDDLGLQPNWAHLAAEAWAQAEIASRAQGSPFLEDWDDEDTESEAAAGPAPGPPPPAYRPPTFQESLMALARDPEIVAAARRDSG